MVRGAWTDSPAVLMTAGGTEEAGSPGPGTIAGAAGLSTGVIIAIVGGVAAVATTVGLAAAGTFSSKSATSTP
jgi:hypothetical protein